MNKFENRGVCVAYWSRQTGEVLSFRRNRQSPCCLPGGSVAEIAEKHGHELLDYPGVDGMLDAAARTAFESLTGQTRRMFRRIGQVGVEVLYLVQGEKFIPSIPIETSVVVGRQILYTPAVEYAYWDAPEGWEWTKGLEPYAELVTDAMAQDGYEHIANRKEV